MRPVIVAHVAVTTSPDYLTRREPHRQAHIERLRQLRAAGTFVAGGAFPDGRGADLFYRVGHLAEVDALIVEDPYHRSGAWAGHASRPFSEFVDPWHAEPPVVLDGSRRVTVVEGPAGDSEGHSEAGRAAGAGTRWPSSPRPIRPMPSAGWVRPGSGTRPTSAPIPSCTSCDGPLRP